jgi:hypothetical protein
MSLTSLIAVGKNSVPLAIRDGEFGRQTVTAVFSVIPAKAGIHPAFSGTGPRIKSGVTVSFPQIGQKFWQLL